MLQPVQADSVQSDQYDQFVNPQWVRFLDVLRMNVTYASCTGAELRTTDGRTILDFVSGYCVHNIGHNHPRLIEALKQELDRRGPAMLQSHVSDLAGQLAEKLCQLAGGRLKKAFFASSGSEGIETVIKFSRAHTGRSSLLYAANGFHGLTCGALSLMSNGFWKQGFGPFLPGTEAVPFGDLDLLEQKLATKTFAAFILEPVQAESGVLVPAADYLPRVQALCRRYGTLLVLDEVQTGLFRTGRFLAAHHFGVEPDMVVLAKALSGGLVPCSAVLMSEAIYSSVYSSLQRAVIHTSTYSENSLAMRAGLTSIEILEQEQLGPRAAATGEALRRALAERLGKYEMIAEIRGLGMLNAIAFQAPKSRLMKIPFLACARVHPGMFGQMLVMRLFRDHGILSQICGNDFMVLKVAPPLVVTEAQLDRYLEAIETVVEQIHNSSGFWTEVLGIGARVVASI